MYNTFSKALCALEKVEYALLQKMESGVFQTEKTEDDGVLAQLSRQGFIVDDCIDELDILKYYHLKARFSNQKMHLTIAPTLACNFACPYCYEKARNGKMSRETQDALIRYIDRKMEEGIKDVDITWYGGEPLLYPKIVDYLSAEIRAVSEKHNADLTFSMVTNGYLIDSSIVEMLVRNQIHDIQITIDGLEATHNERRPHKENANSYQKIISNLGLFVGSPIRVNIRMNIDRKNYKEYNELHEIIKSIHQSGANIALYPALVEHLNKDDVERDDYYMSAKEYEEFLASAYVDRLLADEGLSVVNNRRYYCSAELNNTFVVDEQGNFYKCWDEIGISQRCCFNVAQPLKINYPAMLRFMLDEPFSNPACKECPFLPLCFGGCKFQKQELKKNGCNFTMKSMKRYLEQKYFSD